MDSPTPSHEVATGERLQSPPPITEVGELAVAITMSTAHADSPKDRVSPEQRDIWAKLMKDRIAETQLILQEEWDWYHQKDYFVIDTGEATIWHPTNG